MNTFLIKQPSHGPEQGWVGGTSLSISPRLPAQLCAPEPFRALSPLVASGNS